MQHQGVMKMSNSYLYTNRAKGAERRVCVEETLVQDLKVNA